MVFEDKVDVPKVCHSKIEVEDGSQEMDTVVKNSTEMRKRNFKKKKWQEPSGVKKWAAKNCVKSVSFKWIQMDIHQMAFNSNGKGIRRIVLERERIG